MQGGNELAIGWLRERGIHIEATNPEGEHTDDRVDLCGPIANAVGSKRRGLSDNWLQAADVRGHIPMSGGVASLHVSTTAALLDYEVLRHRRSGGWAG